MNFTDEQLRRLIIPLVIEQLLTAAMGIADTVMVASCGEAAVSGISLVDQINVLLVGLFTSLASGGSVVAAQFMGRGDRKMVGLASGQLFLAVGAISSVFMLIGLFLNNGILHLIYRALEPDVLSAARIYFTILAISYPFLGIYNSGAALFRAVGDSAVSMRVSFIANMLNIGGNALLIYGFGMGVTGAALSTLASRVVCAVVITLKLAHSEEIPVKWTLMPSRRILGKILYIGVPNGIENSIFQVGKLIVSAMIAGLGTVAITANAVTGTIANLQNIPGNAIGAGMITVVGQCIGARDVESGKLYIKKLLKQAYVYMIVIGILLIIFARPICGIYRLSPETTRLVVIVLIYNSICTMLIHPLSFALANALRAAGDVRYTMVVAILSMWIFRIGFAYVLGIWLELGLLGIWAAMTIDWLVRAFCFVGRIRNGKWVGNMLRITE